MRIQKKLLARRGVILVNKQILAEKEIKYIKKLLLTFLVIAMSDLSC